MTTDARRELGVGLDELAEAGKDKQRERDRQAQEARAQESAGERRAQARSERLRNRHAAASTTAWGYFTWPFRSWTWAALLAVVAWIAAWQLELLPRDALIEFIAGLGLVEREALASLGHPSLALIFVALPVLIVLPLALIASARILGARGWRRTEAKLAALPFTVDADAYRRVLGDRSWGAFAAKLRVDFAYRGAREVPELPAICQGAGLEASLPDQDTPKTRLVATSEERVITGKPSPVDRVVLFLAPFGGSPSSETRRKEIDKWELRASNRAVDRWFWRTVDELLLPLHAEYPIDEVELSLEGRSLE